MPIPFLKPTTSIRQTPELAAVFQAAEGRHLSDQELLAVQRAMPTISERVKAAREVSACEAEIIRQTIDELFLVYPIESTMPLGREKTVRDMSIVSAYATLSMVMNDPHWYRDKLLLWLRTILQACNFPDRQAAPKTVLFGASQGADVQKLPPNRRVVFEGYTKLKANYQLRLSPGAFTLMEPYLQQTIDTLTAD